MQVAKLPPFGEDILTKLTLYYHRIMAICNVSCFPLYFLIAGVTSQCLHLTSRLDSNKS